LYIEISSNEKSVRIVRDWYLDSYKDLTAVKEPTNSQEEQELTDVIQRIYDRHAPTPVSVAKGVFELKQELRKKVYKSNNFDLSGYIAIHENLDMFYQVRNAILSHCYSIALE
jgi:hypothetical protein